MAGGGLEITNSYELEDAKVTTYGHDQPIYTSHHVTKVGPGDKPIEVCKTRIDQIYTPLADEMQWDYALDHDFWRAFGPYPDHIAQTVTLAVESEGKRGRDLMRPVEDALNDPAAQQRINAAIQQYDQLRIYGYSPSSAWERTKTLIKKEVEDISKAYKLQRKVDTASQQKKLMEINRKIETGGAEPTDYEDAATIRSDIQRMYSEHKSTDEAMEHFHRSKREMFTAGTKQFHRRFSVTNSSQWVHSIRSADWSDISTPIFDGNIVQEPENIAATFTPYYQSLFARRECEQGAKSNASTRCKTMGFCNQRRISAERASKRMRFERN